MPDPYMPLGEPTRGDVDRSARLLLRYEAEGLLGPEFGEMWLTILGDEAAAVSRRADELRAEPP